MVRPQRSSLVVAGLVAFAALFVVLYVELARSGRFPPDDMTRFASVRHYGALVSQWRLYQTWSGRWASNMMVSLVMSVLTDARSVFPYALALLGVVVATTWLLARLLLADLVRATATPLLAAVTAGLLFYATPERGDSWFFVFCSLENVLPLCCGLLALACVRGADARPTLVVPAALLAAVATGGHESVALGMLAAGTVACAVALLRERDDVRVRTGVRVLAIASLSFAVSALSPGSGARLDGLPRVAFGTAVHSALAAGPGVLLDVARAGAAPLVASLLVWAAAGNLLAPANAAPRSPGHVLRVLGAILVLAPIVALAATFPGFLALGEPPPARAQLVLAVFLVVASVVLGSTLGSAARVWPRSATPLATLALCALALVATRESVRMRADIATARLYAAAYDARIAALKGRRFERDPAPILLAPLPPSGVLRSAEISGDDPRAYANRSLRRLVSLRRFVLLAKEPAPD